jgi:hypothetical protein
MDDRIWLTLIHKRSACDKEAETVVARSGWSTQYGRLAITGVVKGGKETENQRRCLSMILPNYDKR